MNLLDDLKDWITTKEREDVSPSLVMKKVDEEQQRIIGVVLEPNVVDLHNDTYSAEEVAKACENFNTNCMQPNVQHMVTVGDDAAVIEKSFILEVDALIGDQKVVEGTWVQQWKINDSELWDAVKGGVFTGFSIGGQAYFEDIE